MARDPIHPGKFLADELEALRISGAQLAAALHVAPNRIYQILSGQRALTADTALRLGRWFGTPADLWMNLQKTYELRLTERQASCAPATQPVGVAGASGEESLASRRIFVPRAGSPR